ncbi:uncharacterized protein [Periplaneta americana]|uniref:uncharacterized protein n=1 Tax=Periplaneta americana TaxID=6978 RepID=UPI0037E8F0B3
MDKRTRRIIFKAVELVLVIVCGILYYAALDKAGAKNVFRTTIKFVTAYAYAWILAIFLIVFLLKKEVDKVVTVLVYVLSCLMLVSGGAVIIDDEQKGFRIGTRDYYYSAGAFGIITGVLCLADAIISFFDK